MSKNGKRKHTRKKKHTFVNVLLGILIVLVAASSVALAGLTLMGYDAYTEIRRLILPIHASSISFSTETLVLGEEQEYSPKLTLIPGDCTDEYKISSTDEEIVEVTADNKLKANGVGECTVKATTDNGKTAYCDITVKEAPDELDLPESIDAAVSESFKIHPLNEQGFNSDAFSFKSANKKVAVINSDGLVTPVDYGKTTITVTAYNNTEAKLKLRVLKTPIKFSLNGGKLNIGQGSPVKLSCDFEDGYGAYSRTYESDDEDVLTVDSFGNVEGLKNGKATVTCTLFNNISSECEITVNNNLSKIRTHLDPARPMVALTFDDGPYKKNTKSILDTLAKYDARATFFVVGTRVAKEPETLKLEYEAGHEIGSHSWDHGYAVNLSEKQQRMELKKANDAIHKVTGAYPTLFRCPGGISCDVYVNESNMPLIQWSIDTRDWETQNSESTYQCIKKVFDKNENLNGDIVLMHDIQDSTPAAVKKICKLLDKQGYQLVTVSELAYYKGVKMQNGVTYLSFYG